MMSKTYLFIKGRSSGLACLIVLMVAGCEGDCELARSTNKLAPDGAHSYDVEYSVCSGGFGTGSEEYDIYIRAGNKKQRVFSYFLGREPVVSWYKNDSLSIKVEFLPNQTPESLSSALGVNLRYEIGSDLSPEGFNKWLAWYEEYWIDRSKTDPGLSQEARANARKDVYETVKREKDNYAAFMAWASSNKAIFDK